MQGATILFQTLAEMYAAGIGLPTCVSVLTVHCSIVQEPDQGSWGLKMNLGSLMRRDSQIHGS